MTGLSFVTLLAFDYRYAFRAISSHYPIADEIILGLDADRLTWARQPFDIDMNEVREFIEQIDVDGKIRIVEGNFHTHDQPLANDTAERSELSKHCAADNWVVQIDADEILLNADEFRRWMLSANPPAGVAARWVTVFKVFGKRALVIDPAIEMTPVATRLRGKYDAARRTQEDYALSPLQLLHFSWGRTPEELLQKLQNWGHAGDFDTDAFFRLWQSVTLENHRQFRDFHPLSGPLWKGLKVVTLNL